MSREQSEPLTRAFNALVLVLLLSVSTCAARAAESTVASGRTVLIGQLNERQRDGTVLSLPFTNVLLPGTRRGTMSDEFGRFRIEGLSTGRISIRVLSFGYSPHDTTLDVVDADSVQLEMTLDERESKALPESRHVELPPSELLSRMRNAKTVRAYRSARGTNADSDTGGTTICGIGLTQIPRNSAWAESIRGAFGAKESWRTSAGGRVDGSELCGLRFEDPKGWLEVLVWPRSRDVSICEHDPGSPYWTQHAPFSWRGDAGSLRRWFE